MSTRTKRSRCSRCHRKVPKRRAMPARRDPIRSRPTVLPSSNSNDSSHRNRCSTRIMCKHHPQRRQLRQTPPSVHRCSATSPVVQVACRCWQTTTTSGQTLLIDSCCEAVLHRPKNNSSNRHRRPALLLLVRPMVSSRISCCIGDGCSSISSCSTVRRTTVLLAR